jgi:DivIVA domain-containing protein
VTLSPDDIVGYEFRQQKVRGYDVDEVDDLLDRLADQVERTDQELADLRRRLREAEARLGSALETESTLKRTLVTAQEAAERALADAREQADELRETAERAIDDQLARAREEATTLVTRAQHQARAELEQARSQRIAVEGRLAALRALEDRHRRSLERHLRAQLDQLTAMDTDPDLPSHAPVPPRADLLPEPRVADDADGARPVADRPSHPGRSDHLTVRVRPEAAGIGHDAATTDRADHGQPASDAEPDDRQVGDVGHRDRDDQGERAEHDEPVPDHARDRTGDGHDRDDQDDDGAAAWYDLQEHDLQRHEHGH